MFECNFSLEIQRSFMRFNCFDVLILDMMVYLFMRIKVEAHKRLKGQSK